MARLLSGKKEGFSLFILSMAYHSGLLRLAPLVALLGCGEIIEAAPSSSDSSRIMPFYSSAIWQLYFNNSKDSSQLMVIDFTTSSCGPCKFFKPAVHAMASKLTDVDFAKIDVDELLKGKEVDRVVGAKKDELEKKIEKHRALQSSS